MPCSPLRLPNGFLARLLRDRAGNAMALTAAALFPLLGLIGGGIDIGRGYISQSRLQQACDAGVLAARKRLGAEVAVTGEIPAGAAEAGERFFNLNFQDGSYGSEDRTFEMTLEDDFSISGRATVDVPTTLMSIFGFTQLPVNVECEAQLNMSNMDVMMVLDTTGSMAQTNPGDTQPKIEVLRDVVKSFYAQLEANRSAGARTRFGFVPYSANVNVGYLLKSDWVVDEATVQARVSQGNGLNESTITPVSGTATPLSTTTAGSCPQSNVTWTDVSSATVWNGKKGRSTLNGTEYQCEIDASTGLYTITGTVYEDYVFDWLIPNANALGWSYEELTLDASVLNGSSGDAPILNGDPGLMSSQVSTQDPLGLKSQFRGCIMERETYEIGDYDDVDIAKAIDLDIDRVPDPADAKTQWRPLFSELYLVKTKKGKKIEDLDILASNMAEYLESSKLLATPSCPSRAQKLQTMTASQISAYVDALAPSGNTYHDIGMIWGGRLLSPTGLFASENADQANRPTSRHLIFLTDGETATSTNNYATYGLEAVEERRWRTSSSMTLNSTVENRFAFACDAVRNRNITVWVISFGIGPNDMLEECAGSDKYFAANDATDLAEAFSTIATRMGELRVTR